MKLERLPDGRIAVTLQGDAKGYYVWSLADARRLATLLWQALVQRGA